MVSVNIYFVDRRREGKVILAPSSGQLADSPKTGLCQCTIVQCTHSTGTWAPESTWHWHTASHTFTSHPGSIIQISQRWWQPRPPQRPGYQNILWQTSDGVLVSLSNCYKLDFICCMQSKLHTPRNISNDQLTSFKWIYDDIWKRYADLILVRE